MAENAFLRVERLTKKFAKNTVLEEISFEVQKKEVLVLCGPSGCGKSTLLRCLNGLETIDGGDIWLDGCRVNGASHKELMQIRLSVGFVFQNFNLFPHMTALRNVTLAPVKLLKQDRKEAEAQAMSLLEMVGIPEKADAYPCSLSGGQRQRVAIARALALKPRMMLFDEPTSALDPEMKEEVFNTIERLRTDEHMTMILVTHEIGFTKHIADRVMMLEDREIVEMADAKAFFENPREPRTREFLRSILSRN